MNTRLISILVVLLLVTLMGTASAQSTTADTPLGALQSYYDALNRGDYVEAFGYIRTDQNFYEYVTGFSDTTRIEPYFGAVQQSSSGATRVPAVLLGYQENGNTRVFAGCFFMQPLMTTGADAWAIANNTLVDLGVGSAPILANIRSYITSVNCFDETIRLNATPIRIREEAEYFMQEYFQSIRQENYLAAYGMWLFPLPGEQPNGAPAVDYRPPITQFIGGYNNTLNITVYTGAYQFGGATAGKSYLDGYLPVVLIGHDRITQDEVNSFVGCYVMGRFVDGRMGIVNGNLQLLQEGVPTADTIIDALNVDCTSLGISL